MMKKNGMNGKNRWIRTTALAVAAVLAFSGTANTFAQAMDTDAIAGAYRAALPVVSVAAVDRSMKLAAFGIVGLETSAALTYTELVEKGVLTPMQMAEKMSYNPAKILHLDKKGSLAPGMDADVVVIDPEAEYVIDPKAALPGRIYQKDKPWSCAYCYWWGKAGCTKSDCWYLEPVKPEKPKSDVSKNCKDCPYGKHLPCIGYCIAEIYRELKSTGRKVVDCRMK